ncbi:hypothetical protein PEDI_48340 [Persicobacter diffluens]|uniref:Uncharacterized protein n=1 Tax=Persicobacter diffluens TaxID=981 RepID=A0AAN4W370_9BACT|nr:hypothetical protein PEDI_48340 [Persicobacter diffluens]
MWRKLKVKVKRLEAREGQRVKKDIQKRPKTFQHLEGKKTKTTVSGYFGSNLRGLEYSVPGLHENSTLTRVYSKLLQGLVELARIIHTLYI